MPVLEDSPGSLIVNLFHSLFKESPDQKLEIRQI